MLAWSDIEKSFFSVLIFSKTFFLNFAAKETTYNKIENFKFPHPFVVKLCN